MGAVGFDLDLWLIVCLLVHIIQTEAIIRDKKKRIKELMWPIERDGVLRWEVEDFLWILLSSERRTLLSQEFYTPQGHKMVAQLCLNDGGRSLSLFVAIRKGPDDASIQWPLPYSSFSFQVRRHDGGEPWERIYQVDHLDQKFSRPFGGESGKFGFVKFISMDELVCTKNKFMEDGKISIMISVNE